MVCRKYAIFFKNSCSGMQNNIRDCELLRAFINTFLVYMHKLGVLPGTGIPAFVSLMKYF